MAGDQGGRQPKRRALLWGGRSCLPGRSRQCPICGSKMGRSAPVCTLRGGAALLDSDAESYGPSQAMLGFLDLTWEDWVGRRKDGGFRLASLPIGLNVRGGQFSIRVCSTGCLRRMFTQWVDDLEEAIAEESARSGATDT